MSARHSASHVCYRPDPGTAGVFLRTSDVRMRRLLAGMLSNSVQVSRDHNRIARNLITPNSPRLCLRLSSTSPKHLIHHLARPRYLQSDRFCPLAPAQYHLTTAFGRVKGLHSTTASALILLNLQVVSARPGPHVFNNVPPPKGLVAI